MGAGETTSAMASAVGGLLRGGAAWVAAMRRRLTGDEREQSALHHLAVRPDWAAVRRAVEQVKGEAWEQFAARHGDVGRDVALYVLRREAGLGLRMAGALVGLTNYYAAAQAVHRFSVRLPRDQQLQRFLREALPHMKTKDLTLMLVRLLSDLLNANQVRRITDETGWFFAALEGNANDLTL